MNRVRWAVALLCLASLPGCRGCGRDDRVIVRSGEDGLRLPPEPGTSEPTTVETSVGGSTPGERSFTQVAVHGGEPDFRIDATGDDGQGFLEFDGTYGCLSSRPIRVGVTRITNRWSVYRVVETRGSGTRTYYVSDPLDAPNPGCEGCSHRPEDAVPEGRASATAPSGRSESTMSLAAFGLQFDWQVIPAPGSGSPQWRERPILRGGGQVIREDGFDAAVHLCRAELDVLAATDATDEAEFVVGVRFMQSNWPRPAPVPELELVLWSKPISMGVVRRQRDVLQDGELPVDPGVTKAGQFPRPAGDGPRAGPAPARGAGTASVPIRRRGSVSRVAVRGVRPVLPSPGAPNPSPGTPSTSSSTESNDLRSLVERSLGLPANAGFRAWLEASHSLRLPASSVKSVSLSEWRLPDGSIANADLRVDVAAGSAIERHFGIPDSAFPSAFLGGDEVRLALEELTRPLARMHGVTFDDRTISIDHPWIVDVSIPVVRPVARSLLAAAAPAAGSRQALEVLASFVQTAVPYRRLLSGDGAVDSDGHRRLGLRTPVETLLDGGDCDSKSLLLAALIRSIDPGIPVALVSCMGDDVPHMMIAVGCESREGDAEVSVDGIAHVIVETTAAFPVGRLPDGITQLEPRSLPDSGGA